MSLEKTHHCIYIVYILEGISTIATRLSHTLQYLYTCRWKRRDAKHVYQRGSIYKVFTYVAHVPSSSLRMRMRHVCILKIEFKYLKNFARHTRVFVLMLYLYIRKSFLSFGSDNINQDLTSWCLTGNLGISFFSKTWLKLQKRMQESLIKLLIFLFFWNPQLFYVLSIIVKACCIIYPCIHRKLWNSREFVANDRQPNRHVIVERIVDQRHWRFFIVMYFYKLYRQKRVMIHIFWWGEMRIERMLVPAPILIQT